MADDEPSETGVEKPTETSVEDPTDLRWIGPATADVIDAADFDASAVAAKRVSYRMLVDAGVNPGVAAKIRREHSLSWSFESTDDLDRRSAQIRGLGDDEAAWVAASSGDWEARTDPDVDGSSGGDSEGRSTDPVGEAAWVEGAPSSEETEDAADADARGADRAESDGSGDPVAAEAAWRHRSKPTPVATLDEVSAADADQLADAGITSVRSLATADPEHVADVLELDPAQVADWHEAAENAAE